MIPTGPIGAGDPLIRVRTFALAPRTQSLYLEDFDDADVQHDRRGDAERGPGPRHEGELPVSEQEDPKPVTYTGFQLP